MDPTPFYLGFNLAPGIGPARIARLIAHFGTAAAAWGASTGDLVASGLDAKSVGALVGTRSRFDLDTEMDRAARMGVQLICIENASYPALLRQIPQPPPLIYIRGTLAPADAWALAVIGTRGPTMYGREATRRFAGGLAAAGITVVSGLALGIDSLAHTAALEAGGRTIAVLASGVDIPYPEQNRRLAAQIIENGMLISEYPLGTVPVPNNFPARNRLISGLASGTLVVEAGARSGALITVEFALEQGRDVFAVPGEIFSRQSEGTHRLIRNGAALVSTVDDILDGMNWTAVATQQEVRQILPDDPIEAALLEQLGYQPQHIDELGRATGLSASSVAATLAMLELKGAVRQASVTHYVLAR